jgi:TldD protein
VDAEITAKVELVMRADKAARAYDPRIKEVRASYADELRNILVVGSDGTFAEDSQPLARMNVFLHRQDEGSFGSRRFRRRRTRRARLLLRRQDSRIFCQRSGAAGDSATRRREAPAGEMEVVLGPGWPEFCCTKPSATAWKPTSIARRLPHSPD